MPTRLSLLFTLALSLVAAAQGPFTSSLVFDPNNPTTITTVLGTVTVTLTVTSPATTITLTSSTTTTTTATTSIVTSPPPGTTTTTIRSDPHPSSPSNVTNTPTSSATLVPHPGPGSNPLTQNPGALAGLIIGICLVVAGLIALAWFTVKRHNRLRRDLEGQTPGQPAAGAVRRSASAGNVPSGHGHSRIIDEDHDFENQSYVGHEVRSSSTGHGGITSPVSGVVGPEESPEQRVDYESGYLATYTTTPSSVGGHSSHGHGTVITRDSSLTQVNTTIRNTSPSLSRQNLNRTRFSLSPDRSALPVAWHASRSEAPTRRGSVDEASTVSYNPHRASSEPFLFHDIQTPIYHRRQSSEIPRLDALPRPAPVHTPPPNLPSSLLRPPSATQVPTLQTPQRSHPSGVYLTPPFVNEPVPSPAASNISVLSGREGLLGTPPSHPAEISDGRDYSRRLGTGVVSSGLRDSTSMVDADIDSVVHPDEDSTHQRSALR